MSCELLTEETILSSTDFIITDYDDSRSHNCQFIRIDEHYFEPSKKIAENIWVCSTYKLNELTKIILQLPQNKIDLNCVDMIELNTDCGLPVLTILIVDDHPINRLLLTDQLKK